MAILSQKEIAKLAGVSQATVSRCLRNDPAQNSATRERVLRLAGKMGYVPNSFAAGLAHTRLAKNKSSRANLAVIVGNQDMDPIATWKNWSRFYRAARQHAEKHGYSLEYFWLYGPGISAAHIRRVIEARGIMGVVLLMVTPEELDLPWDALSLGSACISPHLTPRTHYIGVNTYHDACMAFQTSANLGYRRPALIYSIQEDIGNNEGAYTAAFLLHQRTLAPKDRLPVFSKPNKDFLPWFKKYRPDIIFAMYGEPFRQLADRIPKEVGFVNFSGLDYGILPGSTYISQRHDLAGVAAVDLIMGQLSRNERGWPENPNCVIVPSEWHSGTTTRNQRDDDGLHRSKSRGRQRTRQPQPARTAK
jgi:DNA-binding LacI/PurR family transcriptional regulator